MAIPERPLKLTFDPDDLTLPELVMVEGRNGVSATDLMEFIEKYGDWTPEERRKLQRRDVLQVWSSIRRQVRDLLVPKVNGPP